MNILTKSQLQKNIGKLENKAYIIVNRGTPESIIVPYFEGNEEWIEEYLENFEIAKNKENLMKKTKKSLKSGLSDLVI